MTTATDVVRPGVGVRGLGTLAYVALVAVAVGLAATTSFSSYIHNILMQATTFAVAVFGLTVVVTAGSPDKCARAVEIGAAHAIDYKAQDFVEEVKRFTGGRGVAVVLDMVGGDYVPRNLACLAEEGRHVSIAAQRGPSVEIPIWDVMRKRLTLTGSTLRARSVDFKATLADELKREVWPHLEAGRIRPVIHSVFPLADAAGAHRLMDSGDHVGKIVLRVES